MSSRRAELGAAIRARRLLRGWRQLDLAAVLATTRERIADLERGRGWPTEEECRALRVILP